MWRNADVVDFVGWLREWNDALPPRAPKVGFYGLDLYSLHTSMEAVVEYLDGVDPEAAETRARALRMLRSLRPATRRCTRTRPASAAPSPASTKRSSS